MNVYQMHAKLNLQTALILACDLQAFRAGDVARFTRMVNARGKQIMKPDDAVFVIKNITEQDRVKKFYPVTCRALVNWLLTF